ncbi:hypothetical protein ACGFYV_23270 [Streptomyces sp. NPDC048297]|uniref:hypothetical protein n=1 Tax=Streptomyces sp. NPDC048297 TaxID=3365531 RepID=UPI003722D256
MTETTVTRTPRKGLRTGVVSELSVILRVKEGRGQALREFFAREGADPEHVKVSMETLTAVGTLHESRYVLFDDDTRLLIATSFDGDWDPYIEDFARSKVLANWSRFLIHCEGFPEEDGVAALTIDDYKEFLTGHQVTATEYYRVYPDMTVRDVLRAQRVVSAFNSLLDEAAG